MAPTAPDALQALTNDNETALLAGLSDDNNHTTPNEQVGDPALATAAPMADFIRNIDPRNVNNIDQERQPAPLDPDDIADFTTLTILCQAVADDNKLQIIFVTIELQVVALARSLQHDVILYNGRYFIPATSPLLKGVQESLQPSPTAPQLLAVILPTTTSSPTTLDHNASPSVVLLRCPWPQGTASPTTVIFINDLDCLLLYVVNVHIGLHYNKPRLSPNAFTNGQFILGDMLILATTPSTMYHHFSGYILLNVDNRPHNFASTPQTLHQLYIDNGMGGMRTSNHYAFGSFGSYDINIGQAHGALGHVIVQIVEIPWGTRRPPNNSSAWRMFQCEDALIGEGGVLSHTQHRLPTMAE
jgi:hypothetical protein